MPGTTVHYPLRDSYRRQKTESLGLCEPMEVDAMTRISRNSIVLVSLVVNAGVLAVGPQPQEFDPRSRWLHAMLDNSEPAARPHLELLYEDTADGMSRGQSWRGTPYQFGDRTYTNGNDYGPLQTPLGPGVGKHLGGSGGRPTNADWSYFNLEWGGEGAIVAVGWPGQWAAEFVRDAGKSLHLWAGQGLGLGIDVRLKDLDYATLRRLIGQWRQVAPNYYGDFYPLTPWTRDGAVWMAWQFDRPEAGEGFVQAFRRHESDYESARLRLRSLDAEANYLVTNLDTGARQSCAGRDLLEGGLLATITDRPGTVLLTYRKER